MKITFLGTGTSQGIPVISSVADGTEVDNILEDVNGYLINIKSSHIDIASTIDKFMKLPRSKIKKMSESALYTVINGYNIQSMIGGILEAIDSVNKPNEEDDKWF